MAGIHCCYRRLIVLNTSRLTDKNGIFLQFIRRKHHIVFQMSSLQSRVTLQKPKLLFNTKKLVLCRLVSTNTAKLIEPVSNSNLKVSEVKSESQQSHQDPGHSNNEALKLNIEPEAVGSSNTNVIDESLLPPVPSTVPEVPNMDFISMGLKEPSFQSLGLGSWWPSGVMQQVLEFMHINMDLPWWETILLFTLVIRTFLFPFNVSTRRDSIIMMNHIPKIREFQEKVQKAKLSGDYYSVALHGTEMQNYIRSNNINLFSVVKIALIQAPVFISMYYALNGMAKAPVESLKTDGLFWFKDLTQPDPYYILPVILAGTLFAVIETGSEGNPAKASSHVVKWCLRGVPILVFIFSLKFAACVTWYWTISNILSLTQVALFKTPVFKRLLKIPNQEYQSIKVINNNKKGFIEGFKEGIENAKITSQIQEREKMNLVAFQKAGCGAVPRTFKKNPLLQNAKKSP